MRGDAQKSDKKLWQHHLQEHTKKAMGNAPSALFHGTYRKKSDGPFCGEILYKQRGATNTANHAGGHTTCGATRDSGHCVNNETLKDKYMASIFSRIIAGEIPSYKVAEDENYYAFLDINPLTKGHTLVVPKKEIDYIFDLDDQTLAGMMLFAKKVAGKIKQEIACSRVAVVVLGLEVPHAHIHLIPIKSENDVDFHREKLKLTPEEFEEIAAKLSK